MNKGSVLVCFGYHVQSTRIGIDDRSRYDAELRERGHAGAPLHRPWHCGDSSRWIDKTHVPKWLRVDARVVVKSHEFGSTAWPARREKMTVYIKQDALDEAINMGFRGETRNVVCKTFQLC